MVVDKMNSKHCTYMLVLVVTIVHFAPALTKHITVNLDAKWKSTPLILEAW